MRGRIRHDRKHDRNAASTVGKEIHRMKALTSNRKSHHGLRGLVPAVSASMLLAVAIIVLGGSQLAQAATGPIPAVKATWGDTNLPPGGEGLFTIQDQNIGGEDLEPGFKIIDECPAGVTAAAIKWPDTAWEECSTYGWAICEAYFGISPNCTGIGTEKISCELTALDVYGYEHGKAAGPGGSSYFPLPSGYLPTIYVEVAIDPGASDTGTNTAIVEGGGAI